MNHLHEAIADKVAVWRAEGYPHSHSPAISEILDYAWADDERRELRYLRAAQFRALETYWYLRLVMGTARIPDLYRQLFDGLTARLEAMGVSAQLFAQADFNEDALFRRIRTDDVFVRKHKLESLRETLTLDYPSYILALAMGAGKTILMGTIVATEFAMAQEYSEGDFVQNALIFAPGKTIIESLREIADMPFERILPPRMYKTFAASLKLTFTRDGAKELPIVPGSSWNVVVTNTEKIRIQKPTGRRNGGGLRLNLHPGDDPEAEIANLRLQAIASLPHLAVFSDEAHHTYGQKLLGQIKKVRRTVDYLGKNTNLIIVVNTTGTPYFERQPLKDVVIWYGLGEGIRDGVLKEVARNIKVFDLDEDRASDLVREVVADFVRDYWKVKLPDGAPARLALYFPSTQAVAELRPQVEAALAAHGLDTSAVLEVNNKSSDKVKSEFYRVAGDPASPYRVILLVNMGTEGWNCPSLFACALVRKLQSSNNFVLQAATRCLRQVPGNDRPARIYLASANRKPLEAQLSETYGTSIQALNERETERVEKVVELKHPDLPKLLIRRKVLRFRRKQGKTRAKPLKLEKPNVIWTGAGSFQSWQIVDT
ncbi:MAG TPA: DEAD/DEAH box helicase family protein, partial [Gammaproteobacteria bacterium]|nr:DEAD/DEAH box helicase family protein [Gammaproteobacteria bacterium]